MCKILCYRYTKCKKPANAGPDYHEFAPQNLCDGLKEGEYEKTQGAHIIQVCDKHPGGVPQLWIMCKKVYETVYIRGKCRHHGAFGKNGHIEVFAEENNQFVRQSQLTFRDGTVQSVQPTLENEVYHVHARDWQDCNFRMPDYNTPDERENLLGHDNVSPKSMTQSRETGIMNPSEQPHEWVDADLREIDLLENHYDEINDHPSLNHPHRPHYSHSPDVVNHRQSIATQSPPRDVSEAGRPEPQPEKSDRASNPASNAQTGTNGVQPAANATAAGTGGSEPPPSPPRNPFNKFNGTYRAPRRRSSSDDSDSSQDRSPPSSPARPDGAAIRSKPTVDKIGHNTSSTASTIVDEDSARESTWNHEHDPRLTAIIADIRQEIDIDSLHAEIEDDGEMMYLVTLPNSQGQPAWVFRDGAQANLTLVEWERLLNDARVFNEPVTAGYRNRTAQQVRRQKILEDWQLRNFDVENVIMRADHGGTMAYLLVEDGSPVWRSQNGVQLNIRDSVEDDLISQGSIYDIDAIEARVIGRLLPEEEEEEEEDAEGDSLEPSPPSHAEQRAVANWLQRVPSGSPDADPIDPSAEDVELCAESNRDGRTIRLYRRRFRFGWRYVDDNTILDISPLEHEGLLLNATVHIPAAITVLLDMVEDARGYSATVRNLARDELRQLFRSAGLDAMDDVATDLALRRSHWNAQAVYDAAQRNQLLVPSIERDPTPDPSNPAPTWNYDSNEENTAEILSGKSNRPTHSPLTPPPIHISPRSANNVQRLEDVDRERQRQLDARRERWEQERAAEEAEDAAIRASLERLDAEVAAEAAAEGETSPGQVLQTAVAPRFPADQTAADRESQAGSGTGNDDAANAETENNNDDADTKSAAGQTQGVKRPREDEDDEVPEQEEPILKSRPSKRRKVAEVNHRPHTRSMGAPTASTHQMNLRSRRAPATTQTNAATNTGYTAAAPRRSARIAANARNGPNRSNAPAQAVGRTPVRRQRRGNGNGTTSKGKPRSKGGVQKKGKGKNAAAGSASPSNYVQKK